MPLIKFKVGNDKQKGEANAIFILNIGKYSKVYKQGIFPAISFAVTDNQLEEDLSL
jgi:hypothetical protein